MKYLEIPELGLLASMLSDSSHSVRTMTRIEAYSCKSVASERKLMKSLDQEFTSDLEISTSSSSPEALSSSNALESAFGRLDRKDCRKTFWLLIATLNAAYPDHNFSRVKVEDFQAESPQAVLTKISEALELDRSGANFASTLGALSTSPECIPKKNSSPQEDSQPTTNPSLTAIHPLIRQVLDPVIDLSHCEIYSYCPDADSDPHAVVSDDEEEVESVASSIYGSNRHELLQHSYSTDPAEETMWEIEGVDPPTYIQPTVHLAYGAPNLPTQTISTPTSPRHNRVSHSAHDQVHYLLNSHHNLPSSTMAKVDLWEQQIPSVKSRRLHSKPSQQLGSVQTTQSTKRAVDRSAEALESSSSSLLSLSRPQKKKKSIGPRA
ncbi:uncharacterized protein PGTG_08938 [Puccinia graminis f. sp. tritici CRL 75-36-700-3]|uniref:Uncharacterized protein n=1 Tax=Puccinia graminis f. sp. tritici (strain CRL 75-36-700-3 / race SCCL) TaxID=418459 RepID=E3KEM8_PUCGT|nr:uncharacterized protein PGTG_08938 [Puccinia graminis f. sp. tritici CRL 75-36-700-3]EFP82742.2 hypothetical protein PGTG_08938 [Puccinia graminis f. sp. tritici CRL 75-36-700-3]